MGRKGQTPKYTERGVQLTYKYFHTTIFVWKKRLALSMTGAGAKERSVCYIATMTAYS